MITKVMVSVLAVALGWVAVLAGVMYVTDAAPAAVVMFPDAGFLSGLPEGVAITGRNAISVTLTGGADGITRALYQAGATLVLPAGLLGCAPLTS